MQLSKNNLDKYKNSYRNNRRFIQDNPQDSEFGEMVYVEPNTNQVSSPMMDSQENYEQNEQQIDNQQKDNAYHQTFGKNMKKIFNRPKPEQQIPSRYDEEIYSGSPKNVINVGSSGDDYEYKMPSLIPRRSQNYNNMNNEYNDGNQYEDDDYQEYQNENDIPREVIYSRSRSPQIGRPNRNISPPGYGGAIPLNHMSPPPNYDEINTSTEKNQEQNVNNYNNLKNYLGNNTNSTFRQHPNYINPNQTLKTPSVLNILRDEVNQKYNNKTYNNMSYKDVKKIANRFSKIYDPHRNSNGLFES